LVLPLRPWTKSRHHVFRTFFAFDVPEFGIHENNPYFCIVISINMEEKRYQIMGRFKIVYFYAKSSEVVHVVDIWDSKANPKALIRRIK
jgi:hypothetical protein